MSAEGKKKRGVSGASNAKNVPFRIGGGGVHPPAQAVLMRLIGAADKIGRPRPGSAFDKPLHGLSYQEATARENKS